MRQSAGTLQASPGALPVGLTPEAPPLVPLWSPVSPFVALVPLPPDEPVPPSARPPVLLPPLHAEINAPTTPATPIQLADRAMRVGASFFFFIVCLHAQRGRFVRPGRRESRTHAVAQGRSIGRKTSSSVAPGAGGGATAALVAPPCHFARPPVSVGER